MDCPRRCKHGAEGERENEEFRSNADSWIVLGDVNMVLKEKEKMRNLGIKRWRGYVYCLQISVGLLICNFLGPNMNCAVNRIRVMTMMTYVLRR